MSRIIFITGTDTGVGKTVLTALLLLHLRSSGVKALAMKPFCSGGLKDVRIIQAIQKNALSPAQVNPFYFPEPLAPLAAARKQGRILRIEEAILAIREAASHCDLLLVEGAGGVLVPVGDTFTVADVIASLDCEVVVVARNQLGTINHTNLTIEALQFRKVRRLKVVLMNNNRRDSSFDSNASMLRQTIGNIGVFELPHLGKQPLLRRRLKDCVKKTKKTLAQISDPDSFCLVVRGAGKNSESNELKNGKNR